MTPEEKRVLDALTVGVAFLLREQELDAVRNGVHYNEVKAIREILQDADANLKKLNADAANRKAHGIG